jgi:hypothetical protein
MHPSSDGVVVSPPAGLRDSSGRPWPSWAVLTPEHQDRTEALAADLRRLGEVASRSRSRR